MGDFMTSKSANKTIRTATWALLVVFLLEEPLVIAAESRGGFQPGGRAFTNPFANNPGATQPAQPPGGFFDDDDDDDSDLASPPPGNAPQRPPVGGPSAPQANNAAPDPSLSLGGGPPSGVIANTKVPNIQVDTETGTGSKDIVTEFNFPDADIMDIAKTLGRLTGKNFILDKEVKGRITIISNSPITVGDAWKAFLTALDINGFALIPSGKYIRIARQRDARDKQLKTYTGEYSPDTDALITRVFPLKYINAEEVTRTFRSFMPANSRIIPHEQTNTVIVTDTGSNISKLAKMLEILDIEGYDAGIEVIPVKFASASELSKLIDTLIPGTGSAPGAPPGAPRFGGGGRFTARRTKEGGIINTIISDERTNTLIVHANSKGADQVRELVAKLDQKVPAPVGGGRVHVVYLQFADAEAIASTLNNLSQQTQVRAPIVPGGGTGVNPVAATLFEGSIRVAPDKSTNSLVVTASPADFSTVQRVISRLDIPRDEVYVEVIIMEVNLGRNFEFSSNIASPASGIALTTSQDLINFVTNPVGSTGAVIGFKGGRSFDFRLPNGETTRISSVLGLVKALQSNNNANILATPQIIALDNSEAEFESAEKIPVPVTTQVQGAGTSNSFTKESVSLKIKIKPQINKVANFVKLEVDAKLSDINNRSVPQALQTQAFGTTERSAKTTVVVSDSDTVVLGGLMRDKIDDNVTKIPILGDIPLLGWLFRSKTSQSTKTNLLVFLTPHIVRQNQYGKVRTILDRKLKERDDFIEQNAGGDDKLRDRRDDIIRSLPDMKEIMAKKPRTTYTLDEDQNIQESRQVPPPAAEPVPPQPQQVPPGYQLQPPPPTMDTLAPPSYPISPPPPINLPDVPPGGDQGYFPPPPGGP